MKQKAVLLRLGIKLLSRIDKVARKEEMSRAEYIRMCLRKEGDRKSERSEKGVN